jgi:RNA polymerase sigma factor (sigma-70 family)
LSVHDFTEKELLEESIRGDHYTFALLIKNCADQTYNFAFRLIGNEPDALTLSQQTFIKAFQDLRKFSGKCLFSAWIYSIAADLWKKRPKVHEVVFPGGNAPAEPERVEAIVNRQDEGKVFEVLNGLDDEARLLIVLRDLQASAYDEIACILRCSERRVRAKLAGAREALRLQYLSRKNEL